MNGRDCILTYDLGTTGSKCTVFDRYGHAQYASSIPYGSFYPRPGWAEQDPEDFWGSIVAGTRELRERWGLVPGDIAAIGLCGHMNGCIPVDAAGSVLYRNIIHSDSRSTAACSLIRAAVPTKEFYRITGNRLDPHYSLPKILWIKENHPEIYQRTCFFLNTKDYAAYRLTDSLGLTDYSDASLTCMLDIGRKAWAVEMLKEIGVDCGKLPLLKRSIDLAGKLSKKAAEALGLVDGIPVVVGGGDGACASRGAGLTAPGNAYNYLGSSAWISTLSPVPVLDGSERIFNYYDLDGVHSNVCGTVQSAAASYNWAVDMLTGTADGQEKENPDAVYEWVEREARKSPPGANGIIFLPYLMGERTPLWDENTKGAFVGFTLFHQRADMLRAVYEGIAFALGSVMDVFAENNLSIADLTLIGGGAKSRLWHEILCNVYNKPVKVHKHPGEATSLGAAMAAGVGVGLFKDFENVSAVGYDRAVSPEEETAKAYEGPSKIYRSLYPRLKPVYDALAEVNYK